MIAGRPTCSERPPCASLAVCAASIDLGVARPMRVIASRNSLRSSALSMASALAPIISTPNLASTPCLGERQRGVERGLPAHGRQQRVGPLALDDLGDDLGRDRLDVGGVRQLRIGHDRGRIGVDQDDAVALGLQRLAGLGAGIVELAGLPDDDGARADDEDGFDIRALRHERRFILQRNGLGYSRRRRARTRSIGRSGSEGSLDLQVAELQGDERVSEQRRQGPGLALHPPRCHSPWPTEPDGRFVEQGPCIDRPNNRARQAMHRCSP